MYLDHNLHKNKITAVSIYQGNPGLRLLRLYKMYPGRDLHTNLKRDAVNTIIYYIIIKCTLRIILYVLITCVTSYYIYYTRRVRNRPHTFYQITYTRAVNIIMVNGADNNRSGYRN